MKTVKVKKIKKAKKSEPIYKLSNGIEAYEIDINHGGFSSLVSQIQKGSSITAEYTPHEKHIFSIVNVEV